MKSRRTQPLPFEPSAVAGGGGSDGADGQAAAHAARGGSSSGDPEQRTVAVVGHRGVGKTHLCELLLADTGAVRTRGRTEDGSTLLDASPEARHRRQSVEVSSAWLELGGARGGQVALRDSLPACRIQIVDTPGAGFLSAMRDVALSVVDGAIVAIDALEGVQLGTEDALDAAGRARLPVLAVVTGIDRGLRPDVAADLGRVAGIRAVQVHEPVHEQDQLVGLLDVVADRFLRYAEDGSGGFSPEPVPAHLREARNLALERVAEAVAVTDDALLEHYLEYLELPADLLRDGLSRAVRSRALVPVLLTSSVRGIGGVPLLSAIAEWLPALSEIPREALDHDGARHTVDPSGPFVARVLAEHVDENGERWHELRIVAGRPPKGDWVDARTGDRHRIRKLYQVRGPRRASFPDPGPGSIVGTWDPLPVRVGTTMTEGQREELVPVDTRPPMVGRALRWVDATPSAVARAEPLLRSVVRADPGLELHLDEATGAQLLAGADENHLRLAIERLRRLGAEAVLDLPPVDYVETPITAVRGVEGVHRKTDSDGLVEEFGRCEVSLSPADPRDGTLFVDRIGDVEDDLPRRYRPAIDEGARTALRHGPTAGYRVIGVELALTGGDYDLLQSTDDHFRMAGQRAARSALERVGTRLLEPWWEVHVETPQSALGDVISDISSHRGRILGMEVVGGTTRLVAACPYRELRTFGTRLQTLTGGRATFRGQESHYEPLPPHLVNEVVGSSPHRREVHR